MGQHFVSYARADGYPFVLQLIDQVQRPGLTLWVDQERMPLSGNYSRELETAISDSDSVLFVWSRLSGQSRNCERELLAALDYEKPIIPLKIHSDAQRWFAIRGLQELDFTTDPQAAFTRLRDWLSWLDSAKGRLWLAARPLDLAKERQQVNHTNRRGFALVEEQQLTDVQHPGRIFISYRREESRHAVGRLGDLLVTHFGNEQVFHDIDTIEPGVDFVEAIHEAIGSCEVVLVIIGDQWLTATDRKGRRRLDDPDDLVRIEIESALQRQVRVIPVLVDGTPMPSSDDLPESLAKLARRNAIELSYSRFRYDADRLVRVIGRVLDPTLGPSRR